jgi:hypothetical protein
MITGQVAEWSKALDSSSSVFARAGSNPALTKTFLSFGCCERPLLSLAVRRVVSIGESEESSEDCVDWIARENPGKAS